MEDQEMNDKENISNEKETEQKPTNKVVAWFKKVGAWFKNVWEMLKEKLGIKNLITIGYAVLAVIIIIFIISLSVVSVKYNKVNNSTLNGGTVNGGSSVSNVEESLFNTWKEGYLTTSKYEGAYSLTYSDKTTVTTDGEVESTKESTEKEVTLDDGQYVNELTAVTTKGTTTSGPYVSYEIIKKNGEQYLYYDHTEYASLYPYIVDENFHKTEGVSKYKRLISYQDNASYWLANCSSFEKAKSVLNTAIYTSYKDYITSSEFKIEEKDGAFVATITYSIVETESDRYEYTDTTLVLSVKDGKLYQYKCTETSTSDYFETGKKTITARECNLDIDYASNETLFNTISEGKNPTGDVQGGYQIYVKYYVNGGVYNTNNSTRIGSSVSLIETDTFDWYLDKECTKLYNNEKMTSEGISLYGKLKDENTSKLIITVTTSRVYPDYYPEGLEEEDTVETSVINFTGADNAKTQLNTYLLDGKDDDEKITINGTEYAIKDLSNFTFESNKTYYITYCEYKNGLYS